MEFAAFNRTPEAITEVLKLIARTNTGREILEKFLPLYNQRKIAIKPYPDEIVNKLKAVIGPDQPVGACFVTDGVAGTIHYDARSPLGVLAPFIFHEMVHSLDACLWDNAQIPMTQTSRDQLHLRAETKAFEYQHRFVDELGQRYPEYKKFLAEYYPKAKILVDRLTSTDIEDLYGFKVA